MKTNCPPQNVHVLVTFLQKSPTNLSFPSRLKSKNLMDFFSKIRFKIRSLTRLPNGFFFECQGFDDSSCFYLRISAQKEPDLIFSFLPAAQRLSLIVQ